MPGPSDYFRPDCIALLAHQLMTPLATISATAQSMIRRASEMSEDDVRTRAQKIKRASARLTELIETIMSHTRVKAGIIALDTQDFDLRALVRRICQLQSEYNPAHPFELDISEIPATYRGDSMLLEQAIIIVLSNAIKYSPAEVPIRVNGSRSEGMVSLAVTDQGIGVLAEDLPHIAEPFFRGRNAKHMPGTGLGLSLARHILDLHGGTLHVESKEGQGTTVTIHLPEIQAFNAGNGT